MSASNSTFGDTKEIKGAESKIPYSGQLFFPSTHQKSCVDSRVRATTKQINMAEQAGIYFPTPLPLYNSPPDEKAMQNWIAVQNTPELQCLAKKITANINYIAIDKFLKQLKITVQDFNDKVQEPYVLWIAQENSSALKEGCSDLWVPGLALEHCGLRWPESIITTDQLGNFFKTNTTIKKILLLDDAAYSGTHLNRELAHFEIATHASNIDLYIGVAFMTERAEQYATHFNLLKHSSIKTLSEIFSTKELKTLNMTGGFANQTLTYFDHVFPDFYSTFQTLRTGNNLLKVNCGILDYMHNKGYVTSEFQHLFPNSKLISSLEWNNLCMELIRDSEPLIPTIIRPHRLHNEEQLKIFDESHQKKKLGTRTHYTVPARFQAAKKIRVSEIFSTLFAHHEDETEIKLFGNILESP